MSHLAALAALFLLGMWACGRTGRDLGVPDHGGMVSDETVAFLLVLFFAPDDRSGRRSHSCCFACSIFSSRRRFVISTGRCTGGFGVMFDDLLAAGYTLLCLAAAKAFLN